MNPTAGNLTKFKLYIDDIPYKSISVILHKDHYLFHVPTEKNIKISVVACSNGGCAKESIESTCEEGMNALL